MTPLIQMTGGRATTAAQPPQTATSPAVPEGAFPTDFEAIMLGEAHMTLPDMAAVQPQIDTTGTHPLFAQRAEESESGNEPLEIESDGSETLPEDAAPLLLVPDAVPAARPAPEQRTASPLTETTPLTPSTRPGSQAPAVTVTAPAELPPQTPAPMAASDLKAAPPLPDSPSARAPTHMAQPSADQSNLRPPLPDAAPHATATPQETVVSKEAKTEKTFNHSTDIKENSQTPAAKPQATFAQNPRPAATPDSPPSDAPKAIPLASTQATAAAMRAPIEPTTSTDDKQAPTVTKSAASPSSTGRSTSPQPEATPESHKAVSKTENLPPSPLVSQQTATAPSLPTHEDAARDAALTDTNVPDLGLPSGSHETVATRITTPHSASSPTSASPPADLAQQIRPALESRPGEPVELTLAPEELGRVRLKLDTDSDAIRLHVQAERPETLDMMRRHIDQLSRDFRDMGFTSVSFQFGGEANSGHPDGSAQTDDDGQSSQSAPPSETAFAAPKAHPTSGVTATSGSMDIRL